MTQITDEMVEVAELAMFNATTDYAKKAIAAAYPLIRAAVLEEAAKMCDEYEEKEDMKIK